MDGEIFVLAGGALRLLRTRTATFAASEVSMGTIPNIQTDVVELLTCGTDEHASEISAQWIKEWITLQRSNPAVDPLNGQFHPLERLVDLAEPEMAPGEAGRSTKPSREM